MFKAAHIQIGHYIAAPYSWLSSGTLTVLRVDGRSAGQKSYVWVCRTSGDAERPAALYDYRGRSGTCFSHD